MRSSSRPRRRGGSDRLCICQSVFEGIVVGVEFEPLRSNSILILGGQAEMSGAEAGVALGLVELELDGLLGVGVLLDGGVCRRSVGIEYVVGGSEGDGVREVLDGGGVIAGG
ncbi:unnamed protein product [Linum trigynum]|uniref:Uncharacterized protein n=1 Tax=Linum trigynum TaxID=586398 RepID=A0AAV2GL87_9ROSI